MPKVRTLANGRTITIHQNSGLRKRCSCARRAWATCPHAWHFSFKWRETHHRFPIDRYATGPVVTKADAQNEADRLRREIRAGQFPPLATATPITPEALTFKQFAEKWREAGRADARPMLKANDAAICRRLGALAVDGSPIDARPLGLITEDVIELAFKALGSVAGSTFNKYRDAVRLMQRWGMKKGYLVRPWFADDNETIKRRKTARRDRRLVPDVVDDKGNVKEFGEEKRLLAAASPWLQRLIIAALETGMRRGELLSLTWASVDLTRGVVTVRAETSKTGTSRTVPISPRFLAILRMIQNDPAGKPHKPTAHVFGDPTGGRIADPKKSWLKACSGAGITGLHFHDLRHEAGSRWSDAGWPVSHVQAMLGHASLQMTSTYVNTQLRHLQDSMKRYGTTLPEQPLHQLARVAQSELPPMSNDSLEEIRNPLLN